jgi:hypothetical protein
MGEVWKARKAVAIAALNHPRICQIYEEARRSARDLRTRAAG